MEEEDLKKISEIKNIEGRDFEWIRLKDKGHEGSMRTVLLALYRNAGETWLFPFIGDRDLINEQKKTLKVFLPPPPFVQVKLKSGPKHQLYLPRLLMTNMQKVQHGIFLPIGKNICVINASGKLRSK